MINKCNFFLQGKSRLRNRRRIDPSNAGQGRSRSGMTGAAAAARRAWTTHLCSSHRGRKYNASLLCGREGGGPAGRRQPTSQVLGALARSLYYRTELRKKKPSGRDRHSSVLGEGSRSRCPHLRWMGLGIARDWPLGTYPRIQPHSCIRRRCHQDRKDNSHKTLSVVRRPPR